MFTCYYNNAIKTVLNDTVSVKMMINVVLLKQQELLLSTKSLHNLWSGKCILVCC